MKAVYKFHWDCGRQGDLTGVFVADKDEVAESIGRQVCFGEVLGKHSDVNGTLEEGDLTMVTDDEQFVSIFEKHDLETGHNPITTLADMDADKSR